MPMCMPVQTLELSNKTFQRFTWVDKDTWPCNPKVGVLKFSRELHG